jgi:acyl carrier protein
MTPHIESPPLQPDTFITVAKIVAEVLDINAGAIRQESHFEDDLGGDCLDRLDVVNEIEIKFDLMLEDDAMAFNTIGELSNHVEQMTANRRALHAGASEGLQ